MRRPQPRVLRPGRPGLALALVAGLVAGCGLLGTPSPTPLVVPEPTCGGARVVIPGALPCSALARLAIDHIRDETPVQLDRGIVSIAVELQGCPHDATQSALDCGTDEFVELVTVTFGPALPGGPIEPSLTVGLAPVSGRVMGMLNPLVR